MKPQTIDSYIDRYLSRFQGAASDVEMIRILSLLIREVERDTRHAACDEVSALHNRIANLDH